MVVMITLGEY